MNLQLYLKWIYILSFLFILSCNGQKKENPILNMEETGFTGMSNEKANIKFTTYNLEILNVNKSVCGKNFSSQKDFSKMKDWSLSNKDILQIINNSEKINPSDLHYIYNNLPCEIEATIKLNGKINKITINAGGYYYLNKGVFGCKTSKCFSFFPKEANERDDDDTEIKTSSNSKNISTSWKGNYVLSIDYGKLDQFSEMFIEYNIEIEDNKCTFSGMGYQTSFNDQCTVEERNNSLILKYEKNIDGDGLSDHSKIDTLAILSFKNNKYYVKSPIIANKSWNYNDEILTNKK